MNVRHSDGGAIRQIGELCFVCRFEPDGRCEFNLQQVPDDEHIRMTSLDLDGQAAVGRIAIWAAWLEWMLELACQRLISDQNHVRQLITQGMSASRIIQLYRSLVKEDSSVLAEDRSALLDMLDRSSAALRVRNSILHGSAGGAIEPGKVVFTSRKGDDSVMDNRELDQIGKELHSLVIEVFDRI